MPKLIFAKNKRARDSIALAHFEKKDSYMLLTADFAFSSYRLTKKSHFFRQRITPLIVNDGAFREMLVPAQKHFLVPEEKFDL
jgi:hypothetical protein